MRFEPISFLLGLGAAIVIPVVTRVLRPLAVEASVAGMAVWDETRRIVAEQMEALEDVAAEVRARRDAVLGEANGDMAGHEGDDVAPVARSRRRGNGRRPAGERVS
jgi:hypothetical protein